MKDPAKQGRRATYEDLLKLPEGKVGEIVDGELHVSPRPGPKHAFAAVNLTGKLVPRFGGGGAPGGWVVLAEPELHLGPSADDNVLVPDLAGWKRERLPKLPEESFISVVPNWVCEILFPSNARLDRVLKVPRYASFGVEHLWLIDPRDKTLEAYALISGKWALLGTYSDRDKVRVPPFEAVELELGGLWE